MTQPACKHEQTYVAVEQDIRCVSCGAHLNDLAFEAWVEEVEGFLSECYRRGYLDGTDDEINGLPEHNREHNREAVEQVASSLLVSLRVMGRDV